MSVAVSKVDLHAPGARGGGSALRIEWGVALPGLEALGEIEAVTRNPVFAHRKVGRFGNVRRIRDAVLVLNREIDLRIDLRHWVHAVLAADGAAIEVFDAWGGGVFALRRTDATDPAAWDALIAGGGRDNPLPAFAPPPQREAERPDAAIDLAGMREAWTGMTDVHQFVPLLRRFGVSRAQALRLVGKPWARDVGAGALSCILEAARAAEMPIMVFVDSSGCTQIHTGPVREVEVAAGRLAVRAPGFSLLGDPGGIATCWVVRKPTEDGGITTLEAFGHDGVCRAILCGQRDPGTPERPEWTELALSLSDAP